MAGEWEEARLGELCDFRAGSVFKPILQGQTSGEFPFVKVSDMNLPANAVRIQDANNWVSAADLQELRTKPFPPGTVVFAKIGEALRQNRLRQVVRETVVDNNMMGAVPRINRIDPLFFYYALSRFDFSDIAQGTALPYLTVSSLSALTLDLPPPAEQHAIAHILGTLDDKIELNRRRNQTLEAIARVLFKDWFVDFGPVRAKMEGREPYLPADLWQLFPDRIDDEGKPEGWDMVPASELIDFNPTEPLRKGTPTPYLDMASLPTSGSWPEPPVMRESGSGMRFRNGDTLLARITPCLENGKTAFVQCLPDDTVGWGSTEYIVMRPKAPVPAGYAYLLARDDAFREHAIRSMTGTSGRQRAQGDSVAAFKLASPSGENIWHAFAKQVTPLFESIRANATANETLAQLRDTLLPKLISGELRITDTGKFLGRLA